MSKTSRPTCIRHWSEVEGPDDNGYRGYEERLSIGAPLARHFGLQRMGIHHERLPPGRRTSFPHAESLEEEFVYVLEGTPDVWLDGELYPLKPGDSVGFPAGTGQAHTFINNSGEEVRLLVIGEVSKPENRIYYPRHAEMQAFRPDWWSDPPPRILGDHDGLPDALRTRQSAKTTKE